MTTDKSILILDTHPYKKTYKKLDPRLGYAVNFHSAAKISNRRHPYHYWVLDNPLEAFAL
jgi:hypothetical protein